MNLWGAIDGGQLARSIGITEPEWSNDMKGQFEVDHHLRVKLLLCRGDPHYVIRDDIPSCDVNAMLRRRRGQTERSGADPSCRDSIPSDEPALIGADEVLQWDIAWVDPVSGHETLLFPKGQRLVREFHGGSMGEAMTTKGLVSREAIEHFPESGRLTLYARYADKGNWQPAGEIDRPNDKPIYRRKYRLTLDQAGIVRIYPGEVPYWMTSTPATLRDQPGIVFKQDLQLSPSDTDNKRDPFCGEH
jgi:hypothetical protein